MKRQREKETSQKEISSIEILNDGGDLVEKSSNSKESNQKHKYNPSIVNTKVASVQDGAEEVVRDKSDNDAMPDA